MNRTSSLVFRVLTHIRGRVCQHRADSANRRAARLRLLADAWFGGQGGRVGRAFAALMRNRAAQLRHKAESLETQAEKFFRQVGGAV